MSSEISLEEFPKYSEQINASVSKVLVFHKRSERLASRLLKILDGVPTILGKIAEADLYTKSNVNLLTVTVIDVVEYYALLSEQSPSLTTHLLKYGSDEECFFKWNERLKLILATLSLESCLKLFEAKVDRQDLEEDIKFLRANLDKFVAKENAGQKSILILLDSQGTHAFKTINNVEKGINIKSKSIKYDKLRGNGKVRVYSRCLWGSLEGEN